ncbi:hypothetical protein CN918_26455 [Priestia megaterium]|nr:hypothetical protein CN918_26455 [Priestia megaterium]
MKHLIAVDSNMTKEELKSYLAGKQAIVETIKEINPFSAKVVDIILWDEDDIKVALDKAGIETSEENVQVVVRRFNSIHELMVGSSNEILEDAISDINNGGEFN